MLLRSQDELETSAVELRVAPPLRRPAVTGRAPARLAGWLRAARWPAAVYLGSRLLILVLAGADMPITHRSLGAELSLFDGSGT